MKSSRAISLPFLPSVSRSDGYRDHHSMASIGSIKSAVLDRRARLLKTCAACAIPPIGTRGQTEIASEYPREMTLIGESTCKGNLRERCARLGEQMLCMR